jgi:hypothetical protein
MVGGHIETLRSKVDKLTQAINFKYLGWTVCMWDLLLYAHQVAISLTRFFLQSRAASSFSPMKECLLW